MLRATGVDVGTTDTREVSVNVLFGGPREGPGGRRIASVRSDILTFRRSVLPLANRDTCRRVVQEELAYSLPFDIDEAAWDFTGRPGEEAWVVVAPSDRLDPVRRDAGDATLDAEPLSYVRACMAQHITSALVIDLGASKTTFCGVVAGRVDYVRVMLRGGQWLTNKLAEKQKCSAEQAENLKRSRGTDMADLAELVNDLLAESGLPTKVPYDHVLVCGGGAAMPGLKPFLKQKLGIEPELFPLPAPLSPYEHVAAYGAALAARPRYPSVRLVDRRVTLEEQAGGWKWLAVWAFFLLVLVVADLEVRHYTLQQRFDMVGAALTASVTPVLGKVDIPPDQMLERLKKSIAYGTTLQAASIKHIMDTVGRLSEPLKAFPAVDLRSITVENGIMKLEGSATSVKEASSLNQALGKVIPDLKQINVRTAEAGRFNFTFEGKVPAP